MKNDYTAVAHDLLVKGYATVSIDTQSLIPFIFSEFARLIKEPEEFRSKWLIDRSAFDPNGPEQGPDDGLMITQGEINPVNGDRFDKKVKFHLKSDVPYLLKRRNAIGDYGNFLQACTVLKERCVSSILDLAEELDRLYPGFKFYDLFSAPSAMAMHCLRLLSYDRPDVGKDDIVAQKHVDRNGFTFALEDSRPGLFIVDREGREIPYPIQKGHPLVFPGGKAPLYQPSFHALEHGVRDSEAKTAPCRFSAVCFMHTDTPLATEFAITRKV